MENETINRMSEEYRREFAKAEDANLRPEYKPSKPPPPKCPEGKSSSGSTKPTAATSKLAANSSIGLWFENFSFSFWAVIAFILFTILANNFLLRSEIRLTDSQTRRNAEEIRVRRDDLDRLIQRMRDNEQQTRHILDGLNEVVIRQENLRFEFDRERLRKKRAVK